MKIVPYSAICGGYELPREDVPTFYSHHHSDNPVRQAKIYKVLPHLCLPDADVTVWLDGCMVPLKPLEEIVAEWLPKGADMALFVHPTRDNLYDEAETCAGLGLDSRTLLMEYANRHKSAKGLWECGFLIRRNNERVRAMMETWWAHICAYSYRDQVSFPVAVQQHPKVRINALQGNIRCHEWFKVREHGR